MDIIVLSRSSSFDRHIGLVLDDRFRVKIIQTLNELEDQSLTDSFILIIHAASFTDRLPGQLAKLVENPYINIAIAADNPELEQMLTLSEFGIRAYFNSYMADIHYRHMHDMLASGQTWFTPSLLARTLELARIAASGASRQLPRNKLTTRERDVALAAAKGMSNKKIADTLDISERTVKSHMTRIFAKLGVKTRVALVLKLNATPDTAANNG